MPFKTYTLEDAETLQADGYVPVMAGELQTGDQCAYKPYDGEVARWQAARIVRETRTVDPIMFGMSSGTASTPRTFHETTVWCEHESGAVLVQTFDDRSIVYVNRDSSNLDFGS